MSQPTPAPGGPGKRRWLVALLGVQILLVLFGLVAWARISVNPPPPTLPIPLVAEPPTSLESASPVAAAAAAAWLDDATLMHATLQIDWPWQTPGIGTPEPIAQTGWVSYVYTAPWTAPLQPPGAASLAVLVERLSGGVVLADSLAWASPVPPRPAVTPAIPSMAAVAIAEAAGGSDFRHACPYYRHLTRVSLLTQDPATPLWLVTYEDSRDRDSNGLALRIDATTGEVRRTVTNAPEC